MKKLFFVAIAFFMGLGVYAQTLPYVDNFDSYTAGAYMAVSNPDWWTTWSNAPGTAEDGKISTDFAQSAPNSVWVGKTGSSSTDLILKLGNKTAGIYELKWYMYIESANCGYYNIQHFQSPGIEWAMEIYFRQSGAIELMVDGATINGTYPKDQWFEVKHIIDLDNDHIQLYIDGTMLDEWQFSTQASGGPGTNQLGGIDFFAGEAASSGEIPKYYFDDLSYTQTGGGGDPVITVDPTSLHTWLVAGTTGTGDLTVSNTGLSDLNITGNIIYNAKGEKSAPVTVEPLKNYAVKKVLSNIAVDPTSNTPSAPPATDATAQLHYDGDNVSAIGWNSVPITVKVAARFPNALTLPYAGMMLESVEVYINDQNFSGPNDMTLLVYGMGTSYEPGTLLYSQPFTPTTGGWETITLTTPVLLTGEDLWVGYEFTQIDAGIYIPGTDGGPNDPNGDFLSTGVGWSHLSSNPALLYNWNIRANLNGDPIIQWLGATPLTGTIPVGESLPLAITYDATDLTNGTYGATIRFLSNDPITPSLDVPVTLDVAGVGIGEQNKTVVMIFPNPATDQINVVTTAAVSSVTILDIAGKTVYTGTSTSVNISKLANGVYFIKTVTDQGTSNVKFIKK
jgi:hypothetical protein